jgi:hypothetical protein
MAPTILDHLADRAIWSDHVPDPGDLCALEFHLVADVFDGV